LNYQICGGSITPWEPKSVNIAVIGKFVSYLDWHSCVLYWRWLWSL